MAACLRHRGPDSGGFYGRDGVTMAIRRLRIIDLDTGDQPIQSICTGATIVYNGELYNYRELRRELEAKGHRFRTASDTEVVLHFYEEYGTVLQRLNGIFAFAIHDPRHQRLVLARDHMGVKPLYYSIRHDGTLVFGSEVKALLASGLVGRRIGAGAVEGYLTHGHAAPGSTMYDEIAKLPPSSTLTYAAGYASVARYWDVVANARRWDPDAEPPRDEIAWLIEDAIDRNMIADVPVGAFLSGGVDSSIVTSLMRRHTERLRTYSVGFGLASDELDAAQAIATRLGTTHTAITVTAEDALKVAHELARIYDEPFADAAAIPTYLMARRARQDVTVVLTGEGGDELFGGYRRYVAEQAHAFASLVPRPLRQAMAAAPLERVPKLRKVGQVLRALSQDTRLDRFTAWTEVFHADERRRLVGRERSQTSGDMPAVVPAWHIVDDAVSALMVFELQTLLVDGYLEKVDKATMATSLEARVPLLDPRLVEFMVLAPRAWKLHRLSTKILLRDLAVRWLGQVPRGPKRGFTPPIRSWLETTLAPDVRQMTEPGSELNDLVEADEVASIVDGFRRGQWRERQVWTLLTLALWAEAERTAVRSAAAAPVRSPG